MKKSDLHDIYVLTLQTEQLMIKYAQSKASKSKPWFEKWDLNGLCKKAAKSLAKKLGEKGIEARLVSGKFDIPKAGGNGKDLQLPHCWVEIQHKRVRIIADPTCRQFAKHIPAHKIQLGDFTIPFVGTQNCAQSKAYIQ